MSLPAEPVRIGVVGTGWRAEFFRRVCDALPDRFRLTGVVARDPDRRRHVERTWRVPGSPSLDALLDTSGSDLDFVVSAVSWPSAPDIIRRCADTGMPVLSETPPAPTVAEMETLYRAVGPDAVVEVAEEYPFRPGIAAVLSLIAEGRLGRVHHAQVSVGHGYHGVAVLRRLLDLPRVPTRISAHRWTSPIVPPPGRDGPATDPSPVADDHLHAVLDVDDSVDGDIRSGVVDFASSQYFSPIRRTRLLVRGERGEIDGATVRWAVNHREAFESELRRDEAGIGDDLRSRHLVRIAVDGRTAWANPTAPARLSDDEIAVAETMSRMTARVRGGPSWYPLAEACHDHDLGLAMDQVADTITTPPRAWHTTALS